VNGSIGFFGPAVIAMLRREFAVLNEARDRRATYTAGDLHQVKMYCPI
jgi:hypothetical protein